MEIAKKAQVVSDADSNDCDHQQHYRPKTRSAVTLRFVRCHLTLPLGPPPGRFAVSVPEPEYVAHLNAHGSTPILLMQTALAPTSLTRDVFACLRTYA